MAAFTVHKDFRVPADADVKHLHPGGIYMQGDVINGLSAAEAGELLKLAPAGTFEPSDAEAETVADWVVRTTGGSVRVSGDLDAGSE